MIESIAPSPIEPRDIADIARVFASADRRFTALVGAACLHPGRDLRGLDLAGIRIGPEEDVCGYDFSGCILRGARLCGVDLRKTRFDGADLSGADLRGARYAKAQMKGLERDGCLSGDWLERPARLPAPVQLDPVAEAVQAALREAGDDVWALEDAASDHYDAGRYRIAEPLWAIAADWRAEQEGVENSQTLFNRHECYLAMLNQGRAAEAGAAFRALLPIRERVQGTEHPYVLTTRHELARALLDQGRAAEAEAAFRALLPIYERVQGAEHPDVLTTRYRLAQALLDQGHVAEAQALLERVTDSPGVAAMLSRNRANLALQQARAADMLGGDGATLLDKAEAHMAGLPDQNHYVWRAINAYRAARTGHSEGLVLGSGVT
jgi:tetratricopeptide (TPR) repeat protein